MNRTKVIRRFALLGLGALITLHAHAQAHFSACLDGTGNVFSATVIVPLESTPDVNGVPLAAGSEVAVFSSDAPTLCVGKLTWQGSHGFITVWGDDDMTPARDGLLAAELLAYRVWDSAAGIEYAGESVSVSYAQGDGLYSNDALFVLGDLSITVAPSAPVLAEPFDGATGVSIDPQLTWNASASAVTYHVQVATDTSFATAVVDESGLTSTSHQVTALAHATTYFWRVRATNAGGDSPWSSPYSFTTEQAPVTPPQAPVLAEPFDGATGVSVNPQLTWNASAGADSYHLQLTLTTDSLFATPLVDDSTLTAVFYEAAGLEHETPYRWRVRAGNAGGSSPWASPFVFATEQAPVNQPPVVTITAPADSSSFNQGDSVTFTGTATDPEDGDISGVIAWSSSLDGNLGTGASVVTSSLSVGTHTITASVTDSLGAPGSDQISVTINGPGTTDLHVENIATGTQSAGRRRNHGTATVTIFDDQGNPVAGALVQGTFSGSINETASGTTGAGGTVTLATNGTTKSRNPNINFCVDAITGALPYDPNDNGDPNFACSGGGNPADVHIENIATGKRGAGGGQKRGTATVTIFDDLGNPAAGYTVTGTFSGDFNEAGVSGTTSADGTVTLTTQGTKSGKVNVDFCVDTVTGALPYDPSDNTSSAFACAAAKLGVTAAGGGDIPEDYALEQNYPNPFNPTTIIAYALPEAGPVTLKVYNVLGQEVATLVDSYKEPGRHQVAFDAMRLSAGVYLYVIESGRFAATQRMTLLK